ncbi:MAG: hypothetical protein OXE17_16430 [Chloroflexi bacterium]|nr:hypothetical protein [Chloroflexota bacterium]
MQDNDLGSILEIYKLHSELADKVSQRREGANRLHASLQVGIVIFVAALLRFGSGDVPGDLVVGAVGFLGLVVSISWVLTINAYRKLNKEKFRVLGELETKLPFQFFVKEYDPVTSGKRSSRYTPLTDVEYVIPTIFFLMWLAVIGYVLFCV